MKREDIGHRTTCVVCGEEVVGRDYKLVCSKECADARRTRKKTWSKCEKVDVETAGVRMRNKFLLMGKQ